MSTRTLSGVVEMIVALRDAALKDAPNEENAADLAAAAAYDQVLALLARVDEPAEACAAMERVFHPVDVDVNREDSEGSRDAVLVPGRGDGGAGGDPGTICGLLGIAARGRFSMRTIQEIAAILRGRIREEKDVRRKDWAEIERCVRSHRGASEIFQDVVNSEASLNSILAYEDALRIVLGRPEK